MNNLATTLWKKTSLNIQKITNTIEQIFIYKKKVLIINQCQSILFLKQEQETVDGGVLTVWKSYFNLKKQGNIFYSDESDWLTLQMNGTLIQFYK